MYRSRRIATERTSDSGSNSSNTIHVNHVEQHRVNVLAAAYEEERRQRDQLEKKYARLKRRYIRLERAHTKMIMDSHGMNTSSEALDRSPLPARATYTSPADVREERRSPETRDRTADRISLPTSRDGYRAQSLPAHAAPLRTGGRSSPDADIIDLTSPSTRSSLGRTQDPSVISYLGMRNSRSASAARSLSDDFCAESPDSARGDEPEEEDSLPRRSAERLEGSTPTRRRPSSFLQEDGPTATLRRRDSDDDVVVVPSASRPTSARPSPTSSTTAVSRPRPRLGMVESPDRRIRRGPEQDRDYNLGRRRTTAAASSPTFSVPSPSSAASSPTTINSSPRSSGSPDNDEAASIALAQYLQQQENIAAYEEYEARLRAAARQERESSNQYEYTHPAGARSSSSLLQDRDIDPDSMTYDELLQLGERNGDVKKERWRQMAVHVISRLPTHRWSNQNSDLSYVFCDAECVQSPLR